MIICTRTALESHIVYQQLKEAEVDDESLVTLFAMKEFCDPNSKWRGYFEAMPTSFETHPLFMSDNALDMLQGTLLFDEINNTKQSLKEFSSLMFPFIEQHFTQFFKGVLTIQNLTYIRCVMDTRAFQIDELGFCLLPMIDMCNTNPYPQLETRGYYRAESDSVQLNNMYQTCAGEQLYICYGPYSSRLPDSCVELRSELLEKFDLSLEHYFCRGKIIPSKMVAALRICLFPEDVISKKKFDPFVSHRFDVDVVDTLRNTLLMLLEQLPNVESDDASQDVQMALKYRQCQRFILEESLSAVNSMKI
ncbi:SETD3 [Acrasis kona]|uniref:SETD3 n=1 Tax=Acrasis kona TaxID=1008807 RepID=A0AAW2YS47_9EUKA